MAVFGVSLYSPCNKVEKANNGRYEEFRSELKVEYGLYDQVNLLLSVPYKWARWEDIYGTLENDGVEFVGVGAKLRLSEDYKKNPAASLQVKFETPGSYDKDEPPSLGHGKSYLETRLMVGKIIDRRIFDTDLRLYHIEGEIGYRTLNNKIPYFLEVGLQPTERMLVKGMIDGVIATSDIDRPPTNSELIQKKYEEYSKVMGEILISLSPNGAFGIKDVEGISVGFGYGYTFYGKNTAVGSEITLKLYYRF